MKLSNKNKQQFYKKGWKNSKKAQKSTKKYKKVQKRMNLSATNMF